MSKSRFSGSKLVALAAACTIGGFAASALAQPYPSRTITWVVPYAPGAATDILTRRLAQDMATELGQSIVIENAPGAGTVNAATQLTRAKPDGYRLMTADSATLAVNPALMEKIPYDAQKSFTTIGMFARFPLILVAHKDMPVKNVAEMLAYVRQNAGATNYGSAGIGSPHHLGMELLQDMAGVNVVHVPFNGIAPAMTEILSGRIQFMFSSYGPITQHLKTGALKALAVSGAERFFAVPEVATVADADARLKGYQLYAWQGVVAPAGLPDDIRARLNATLQKVVASDGLKKRFTELGIEAVSGTAASFEAYAAAEAKQWAALVKARNIKAN